MFLPCIIERWALVRRVTLLLSEGGEGDPAVAVPGWGAHVPRTPGPMCARGLSVGAAAQGEVVSELIVYYWRRCCFCCCTVSLRQLGTGERKTPRTGGCSAVLTQPNSPVVWAWCSFRALFPNPVLKIFFSGIKNTNLRRWAWCFLPSLTFRNSTFYCFFCFSFIWRTAQINVVFNNSGKFEVWIKKLQEKVEWVKQELLNLE